jgi:tight adherence protein B
VTLPSLPVDAALFLCGLSSAAALACWVFLNARTYRNSPYFLRLLAHQKQLDRELMFVRAGISGRAFLATQGLLILLGLVLCTFNTSAAAAFLFGAAIPIPLLKSARKRRVAALEKQIETWLTGLSRCLEAAPSLGEAIEASIMMCDAPMREEIKLVDNEIRLGRPIDRALSEWANRVNSRTLTMALATLQVGRETGGQLGEVLKSAAGSLREMARLEGVVRTKTAEGKAQAWVISIVPVPLYFAVKASDPDYFLPLESTATGHLLLAIAVSLWIAATFSARKILAVQI